MDIDDMWDDEEDRRSFVKQFKSEEPSEATTAEAGHVDPVVRPVAWLHEKPERYDVVHDEAKALWLRAHPQQVEHYTIPLYRHERREPLTTEAACALLKDALGIDPMLDGNMLKMLRAVERAHGIGPNVSQQLRPTDDKQNTASTPSTDWRG